MASVGGTGNAITATVANVTLAAGQFFWLQVGTTSSSTTVNINLNGGGNARVKGPDGSADPASGDLIAGRLVLLYFDGTAYRLLLGAPVSATDSTKLPLAGGTITGAVLMSGSFSGTNGAEWIGNDSAGPIINAQSGRGLQISTNGAAALSLKYNAGTTRDEITSLHSFLRLQNASGGNYVDLGSTYSAIAKTLLLDAAIARLGDYSAIHCAGVAANFCVEAQAAGMGSLSAGNPSTGITPGFFAYGLSHATKSGLAATSGGKQHAGDATYRDHYSLAAGSHYGFLFVTDDAGSATIYTINGTGITHYANFGANIWGPSADRRLRISGGSIQAYCGPTYGAGYVSTLFVGTVR
jgi:hypothetical protein